MENEKTFEQAIELVVEAAQVLPTEKVSIMDAVGRVIAVDIPASFNIPYFDNSAMDGYALIAEDVADAIPETPVSLKVTGTIPAGQRSERKLQRGEAIKIMTGSPLPPGADTVIKVEHTDAGAETVKIFHTAARGRNVRYAAEDVQQGETVITRGEVLRPGHIGMLAANGLPMVNVHRRPIVAILTTGDEIIDLDGRYEPGKIYSSNSYSLFSQVIEAGAVPRLVGIARDSYEDTVRHLDRCRDADLVVSSGGISAGDYDFIKVATRKLDFETIFYKCRIRPGYPTYFGRFGGKPFFGLPGNPVSSMIIFEQFARPYLLKQAGRTRIFRPTVKARLTHDIRKKAGRMHFVRASLEKDGAGFKVGVPVSQGSGILKSMLVSNAVILFPIDCDILAAGAMVTVQILVEELFRDELPPTC
jgi:molybdopterin molybdotransferase